MAKKETKVESKETAAPKKVAANKSESEKSVKKTASAPVENITDAVKDNSSVEETMPVPMSETKTAKKDMTKKAKVKDAEIEKAEAPVVEVESKTESKSKTKKPAVAAVPEPVQEPAAKKSSKKTETVKISEPKEQPKAEVKAAAIMNNDKQNDKPVESVAPRTFPEPKKAAAPTKAEIKKAEAEATIKPLNGDVRYSDEDLDMFAKVIQDEKDSALDELRMLKERLDDLTSFDMAEESMIYSMHMAEQGSEAQEKEKTYAQIQRINEYLKKLDDAMDRIKNKTYGICRVCNCLIAKERLLAVPITTLSASYKIHQRCPEDGIDRIEAIKN